MIWELIVLVGLIIGSATDLVRREVPDMLNYSLVAIGFIFSFFMSYYLFSFEPFLNALMGFGVAFLISMVLFKTGQWGGGDAKMLWGIGTLSGFSFSEFPLPFIFKFLVVSMLVGAVYGLLWLFYLAFKNWSVFLKSFNEKRRSKFSVMVKLILLAFFFVIIVLSFWLNISLNVFFSLFLIVGLIILLLYAYLFIKSVEENCLNFDKSVKDLVPGDWVTSDLVVDGEKIIVDKIGITDKQIKILLNSDIKVVSVTEGIPFIPAFLIAFIIII